MIEQCDEEMKTLAFTCGDINGIGPEVSIKTFNKIFVPSKRKIIWFCPANVFENAASIVKSTFDFQLVKNIPAQLNDNVVTIVDIGKFKQNIGKPSVSSGLASFESLKISSLSVLSKNADALITAPVSKIAFKLANINSPGQTELLAKLSKSKKYLMVFLSDEMICGLATIHEPIKNISKLLTESSLINSLNILYDTLRYDLGITTPKIAVLGLNPHAGENGRIGVEERDKIIPAIKNFRKKIVEGPFSSDAFFGNKNYQKYDAVLGMYHDQVLIPFKLLNFYLGVNFTAGLNIIRTSPDHGTAFDIAGKGIADPGSMLEAVKWAEKIISNRSNRNAYK